MKASMHSGRSGNARHNDRSFLTGKTEQEKKEMAPHINLAKTANNRVWTYERAELRPADEVDIASAERAFYAERYGAAQEAKNKRYEAHRHPERRKSTDDLYTGKQTRPEEIILQIGSKDEPVSNQVFGTCLQEYVQELNKWNQSHGGHMHLLSIALHGDETSPHAHIRRVWDYETKDGPTLGQDKALQAAGVELPDPSKPKGRYNNRKMTFDAMMREKWLDICERHGFRLDREPVPGMRHKDKADYIRDQIEKEITTAKEERIEAVEALQTAQKQLKALQAEIDTTQSRAEALRASVGILSAGKAAKIPETAQTPLWGLLGRDKVLVDRSVLEKLAQHAEMAQKATKTAIWATENRRAMEEEAKEQARQIIEQARAQARQIESRAQATAGRIEDKAYSEAQSIRAQARDDAAADRAEQELDRRELREYRKLKKRFPDQIDQLRESSRKMDRQRGMER